MKTNYFHARLASSSYSSGCYSSSYLSSLGFDLTILGPCGSSSVISSSLPASAVCFLGFDLQFGAKQYMIGARTAARSITPHTINNPTKKGFLSVPLMSRLPSPVMLPKSSNKPNYSDSASFSVFSSVSSLSFVSSSPSFVSTGRPSAQSNALYTITPSD